MTIKKSTLFFFLLTSFHGKLIATSTVNIQNPHGVGHMENHGTVHQHIHVQQQEFICNLESTLMERFIYQPRTSPDGQDYITLIARQLERDVTNICGLNLKGMGGVGKSTLAYQYARQHRNNPYKLIWFFRCETKESFEQSLKDMYLRFFPTQLAESMDINRLKGEVYDKLHGYQDKILLIYDNVVDQEFLLDQLPGKSDQIHVIVTSRRNVTKDNQIILGEFSEHEATECLQKEIKLCNPDYSHDLEESQLKEVAQSLGYLPLAIVQAAAYIAQKEIALQDFSKRFEEKEKDFLEYGDKKIHAIPRSFYKLFLMALESLKNEEKELLFMLSYLNPDNISAVFFDGQKAALETLKRYSLIKYQNNQISVHRLLQLVGRKESEIDKEKIIEELVSYFDQYLDLDSNIDNLKNIIFVLINIKNQIHSISTHTNSRLIFERVITVKDRIFDRTFDFLKSKQATDADFNYIIREYFNMDVNEYESKEQKLKDILCFFNNKRYWFDIYFIFENESDDMLKQMAQALAKIQKMEEEKVFYALLSLYNAPFSKWDEQIIEFNSFRLKSMDIRFTDGDIFWGILGTKILFDNQPNLNIKILRLAKRSAYRSNSMIKFLLSEYYGCKDEEDPYEQYDLGCAYYHGKGVEVDKEKAVCWWKKAAQKGHKEAQYNLGCAYYNGNGVEKNPEEALYLWALAAEQGYAPAQQRLRELEEQMAKEKEPEGLSKEDTDYFVKEALKQKELSAMKANQPTVEIDLDDI